MKALFVLFFCVASSYATDLIGKDELDTLFGKLFQNELTPAENDTLFKVLDIVNIKNDLNQRSGRDSSLNFSFKSVVQCLVCESAFGALFDGVKMGMSDDRLVDVLTTLCTALNIENKVICRGALLLNLPILSYIILNEEAATPNAFCALVLQSTHDQHSCPLKDTRFEWSVDLPDPIDNIPTRNDTTQLKIAIITDAHIDPLYEAYGVAECDEPVCCRKGQELATHSKSTYEIADNMYKSAVANKHNDSLLDLKDIKLSLDAMESIRTAKKLTTHRETPRYPEPAGYWGDYRNCDTPLWAFENVMDEIADKHKDIDIIYYIGDSIDHGVWETSYELIKDMNREVVNIIQKNFKNTPIVFTIGNHESQPTNQFAPTRVTGEKINTTWLYDSLVDKWGRYLSPEAEKSLKKRGDYSILVAPGLRAISLNNNAAYKYNWWCVYDPLEAKRHLEWLVFELLKAELAGEKVHILTHIPPGVSDLTYTWTREYFRIVRRFSSTIVAEFNGHTHSDEFKVFADYDNNDTPFGVAWNGGGATSFSDFNLNYKIVIADAKNYQITKMENYIYNLTEANLTPNRKPHWFKLYDLQQKFKLADLTPTSMYHLVTRMVTGEKNMLNLYSAYYSKLSDARWPYCNTDCMLNNLCKTVVTVLGDRRKCDEIVDIYRINNN